MLCAVMYRTSGRSAVEHTEVVRPDRCGFQFWNVPCSDCRRLGWTGESVAGPFDARRLTRPSIWDRESWTELQRRNAVTGNGVDLDSYWLEQPASYKLLSLPPSQECEKGTQTSSRPGTTRIT